ncbi:peptidylprolyl isomerase, partial [Treponema pallidum]
MKIANECVVNIEYTLRDDTGEIIDSSDVMGALEYVQGHGMIIPGLETALINRE